jgi:tRNA threonylcarbamoyladenosine biosynthesis protein TsaB
LAIDTSSEYLSLALDIDGNRSESLDLVGNQQSKHIICRIHELLSHAKVTPDLLDLIAYIEGPGSFTGLRIGLSVALGLSYGANAKLMAIPAFALYAKATMFSGDVLVGIDARLNQIYLAGINAATLDYFIQPQVINPDKIAPKHECVLIGNGFTQYQDSLTVLLQQYKLLNLTYPSAQFILDIVSENKYPIITPDLAGLCYLRNKVALNLEEQLQQKRL